MPSPIKPSEFRALIPTAEDSLCATLVKVVIKLPILFWVFYSYFYTDSGSLNIPFMRDYCAAKDTCP